MDGGLEAKPPVQASSQKFAMGGLLKNLGVEPPAAGGQWGYGSEAPSRQKHGGLGAEPQRSKILHFLQK